MVVEQAVGLVFREGVSTLPVHLPVSVCGVGYKPVGYDIRLCKGYKFHQPKSNRQRTTTYVEFVVSKLDKHDQIKYTVVPIRCHGSISQFVIGSSMIIPNVHTIVDDFY